MSTQSRLCAILMVAIFTSLAPFCHAADGNPDLQWKPLPLDMPADPDARYIDYDGGDDNNSGTRAAPWKHHPWDPEVSGIARGDSDTATYYFKKGVTYRGRLIAKRSGTESRPIVLGVAADWGNDQARISGARIIKSGWRLCRAEDSENLPQASLGKAWCLDTTLEGIPQALWAQSGEMTLKVVPARQPNWTITNPDDPRTGWAAFTDTRMHVRIFTSGLQGFVIGDRIRVGTGRDDNSCACVVIAVAPDYLDIEAPEQDIKGLQPGAVISNGVSTATVKRVWGTHEILRQLTDPALATNGPHDGAVLWVEHSYMPKPMADIVSGSDSASSSIELNLRLPPDFGPKPFNRYFLEGLVHYLDEPGEFVVISLGGNKSRILLRLPHDEDPNQWRIEIPQETILIDIKDRQNIRVAGLEFAFARQIPAGTDNARFAALHAAAIEIRGNSAGIRIDHNRMLHLPAGVVASPDAARKNPQTLDRIFVEDNEFIDIEGSPIALSSGWSHSGLQNTGSRLILANVNRNRIEDCGYRTLAHWSVGAHGHGIEVIGGELVEISGNHVYRSWGSGIVVLMGSHYSRGEVERPLIRGLVHHNKVVDSVLGLQDYGGIASFMGGPLYMYNNISGNAVGYRYAEERRIADLDPFRGSSYAAAYYFDGQYKGYFFNNIGWGKNNSIHSSIYNAVGFKEALGLLNAVFNNSFYRVAVGLHKDMPQHGRSYYLGNLFADISHKYIQHEVKLNDIEYDTLAYGHNVFNGPVANFGQLGAGRRNIFQTLSAWVDNLRQRGVLQSETGIVTASSPFMDAQRLDFRPTLQSPAIDSGVRFFVPWGLARVVGEWHFYASESRPQRVVDESINMNSEWIHRSMFAQIPRHDLACTDTSAGDYVTGTLEDWIHGALRFDGRTRYCRVSHSESLAPYEWRSGIGTGRVSTQQRETLDIGGGNLTIEAVIKPIATGRAAGLLGKIADNGYSVHIMPDGRLRVILDSGKNNAQRLGKTALTDGTWHHVLIEFDRRQRDGITIYVDGRLDNGTWEGSMTNTALRNEADFTLGRVGTDYYAGAMDFIRIAKSTLRESKTDIRELYQWQLDGPATRDFSGQKFSGAARDAGAVEAANPNLGRTGHASQNR